MGCAFDMFSTTWNDRSYVVVLFVLCWCIPLIVIFVSYGSIFFRVRNTNARNQFYSGTIVIKLNDYKPKRLMPSSVQKILSEESRKNVWTLGNICLLCSPKLHSWQLANIIVSHYPLSTIYNIIDGNNELIYKT